MNLPFLFRVIGYTSTAMLFIAISTGFLLSTPICDQHAPSCSLLTSAFSHAFSDQTPATDTQKQELLDEAIRSFQEELKLLIKDEGYFTTIAKDILEDKQSVQEAVQTPQTSSLAYHLQQKIIPLQVQSYFYTKLLSLSEEEYGRITSEIRRLMATLIPTELSAVDAMARIEALKTTLSTEEAPFVIQDIRPETITTLTDHLEYLPITFTTKGSTDQTMQLFTLIDQTSDIAAMVRREQQAMPRLAVHAARLHFEDLQVSKIELSTDIEVHFFIRAFTQEQVDELEATLLSLKQALAQKEIASDSPLKQQIEETQVQLSAEKENLRTYARLLQTLIELHQVLLEQ